MDPISDKKLFSPYEEELDAKHLEVNCNLEQECDSPKGAQFDLMQSRLSLENEDDIDEVPKVGMEFESEDDAYVFYNRYAKVVGFSVRKDFLNKSKVNGTVVSRRFTCFKEGYRRKDKRDINVKKPRKQTRTGCLAQMTISRQPNGKYRVIHFEAKHNHEGVGPHLVHMLPSQRRLAFSQAAEADLKVQEHLKLASTSRYKDICLRAVKISSRAAESRKRFLFAVEKFDEVMQEVEKILKMKPCEENQVSALSKQAANGSASDDIGNVEKEDVVCDVIQNSISGSLKRNEDMQTSPPNTDSSIPCPPPPYCLLQVPTPSPATEGLSSLEANPLMGYMYQPPNLVMCQQSNLSTFQSSNFYSSQHDFPSHIQLPQTMDCEDQHPMST